MSEPLEKQLISVFTTAWGEAAPALLGRPSTLATLSILPAVFALVQRKASIVAASMDPNDPQSSFYDEDKVNYSRRGSEVVEAGFHEPEA